MTTTIPSAALIPVAPVFTNTERLALAGFLAGVQRPDPRGVLTGLAPVRELVPSAAPAPVPGTAARH